MSKKWEDQNYKFLKIGDETETKNVEQLSKWYIFDSKVKDVYLIKGYTELLMCFLTDQVFDQYIQSFQNIEIFKLLDVRSYHYPNYKDPFVEIIKRSCRSIGVIKLCNLLQFGNNNFFSIYNYVTVLNNFCKLNLEFKGINDENTENLLITLRNKVYAHSDPIYDLKFNADSFSKALTKIKIELDYFYSTSKIYPTNYDAELELKKFNGIDFINSLIKKE